MQTVMVQGRTFNYSHAIGMGTPGGAGFRNPVDLALAKNGIIYVLSRGSEAEPCQRITMLTAEQEYIKEFAGPGDGDGEFIWATSIALDGDGLLYLADEWLNRITVYDKDGNFLDKWGTAGTGAGELNGPSGVAFDSEGNLLIAENLSHRVQKFTRDGKFLGAFGSEGAEAGALTRPWGIALDSHDNVYVADWYNNRVQKFSPEGEYLTSFGSFGTEPGKLQLPSDVAVDAEGDVYVTDWWNRKVEVFNQLGERLTTFFGDAVQPSKWAQQFLDSNPDYQKARMRAKSLEPEWRFYSPVAVEVGDDGLIYIVEDQRWRIQVYRKEQDWVDPQFNL